MRVLIVEDETVLAMDLEILVVEQDYYVCDTARDADEAVAKAILYRPDVILMDVRLAGGSDGIEAARRIWEALNIPCIFVSGTLDGSLLDAISPLEPIGFVPKPIQVSMLQSVLKQAELRCAA